MRGTALRSDFDADKLRAATRASKNGAQARRLLALAAIYEEAARSEAGKIAGVTLQIVRKRLVRFNAEPDGLIDRTSRGRTPISEEVQMAALAAMLESGPVLAIHSIVRWRIVDLCQRIWSSACRSPRTC